MFDGKLEQSMQAVAMHCPRDKLAFGPGAGCFLRLGTIYMFRCPASVATLFAEEAHCSSI